MEKTPLFNVLFLKSDEIPAEILASIVSLGCQVSRLRLLSFDYEPFQASLKLALGSLSGYSALALNSVNSGIALQRLEGEIKDSLDFIREKMDVFVVGEKSAKFLSETFGFKVSLIGKNYEDLSRKIRGYYQSQEARKVLYLIGTLSDLKVEDYPETLRIDPVTVYQTCEIKPAEVWEQMKEIEAPDLLVSFSPSNLRFFMGLLGQREELSSKMTEIKHICFGEKTLKELEALNENRSKLGKKRIPQEKVFLCQSSNIKEIPILIEKILKNHRL